MLFKVVTVPLVIRLVVAWVDNAWMLALMFQLPGIRVIVRF